MWWEDRPSNDPECTSRCNADEATCIAECANVGTCGAARTNCLGALLTIEKLDRWRVAIEIDRVTSHGLQCDHTKADKV